MRKSPIFGIYSITNSLNGHRYIGQSGTQREGIFGRWGTHKWMLKNQRHHSSYLQRAWLKYGPEAFIFEVVEECPIDKLNEREAYYFSVMDTTYNVCKEAGGSTRGFKHSAESKKKRSDKLRGRSRPDIRGVKIAQEFIDRRVASRLANGKKATQAQKIANSKKQRKLTHAQVRSIRELAITNPELTQKQIAEMFGVKQYNISSLLNGHIYVTCPEDGEAIKKSYRKQKVSDNEILEIRALAGIKTQQEIADQFGLEVGYISSVISGKSRKAILPPDFIPKSQRRVKITDDQVIELLKLQNSSSIADLASQFNITQGHVRELCRRSIHARPNIIKLMKLVKFPVQL